MLSLDSKQVLDPSAWIEEFDKEVWSRLTERQQKKLCKRFELPYNENGSIHELVKQTRKEVLPWSITIAAMHKAKVRRFDLLHTNPYKKEWADKITYDQDKWGALRKHKKF